MMKNEQERENNSPNQIKANFMTHEFRPVKWMAISHNGFKVHGITL